MKGCVKLGGVYTRNKLFDMVYLSGTQDLPALEEDVFAVDATVSTILESYEDYLPDGWPGFIRDFSE
jgi:hypothetical protein